MNLDCVLIEVIGVKASPETFFAFIDIVKFVWFKTILNFPIKMIY